MVGDGVAALVRPRLCHARACPWMADAIADFSRDYGSHAADASQPFPGARAVLSECAAAGWRMAVCTNKPEAAARILLDSLGLTRFVCAVGGGDSFPVRKPDPAHLLATLEHAGGDIDRRSWLAITPTTSPRRQAGRA